MASVEEDYNTYQGFRQQGFEHRYISPKALYRTLKTQDYIKLFCPEEIGRSTLNQPICATRFGSGDVKVLIFSQMHGNEETGTLATLDLLNYIRLNIILGIQVRCIPMLNPDGSLLFSRENAQGIDINRDCTTLRSVEVNVLLDDVKTYNPDYVISLHDQRTLFGVSGSSKPATLAFLAPSIDMSKTVTPSRLRAMKIIGKLYIESPKIASNISRFSDEYYPTASGDTIQKMGISTILIESGGGQGDLYRRKTRYHTFQSLVTILNIISKDQLHDADVLAYLAIPENKKQMVDFELRNVSFKEHSTGINTVKSVYLNLKEFVESEAMHFKITIDPITFGSEQHTIHPYVSQDNKGQSIDYGINMILKYIEKSKRCVTH